MAEEKPKTTFFCLAVKLGVKPERREEFLKCIANNQRGTLDKKLEPLALEYMYGEDETTPNTFHFFEKYKGKEGFEAHKKAPHFAAWETFAATDPFTSPPAVVFFEEVGPAPNRGKGKGSKGKGKGNDEDAPAGYCLNVQLRVKPEKREEFLEAVKADQKGSVTEERLCMNFLVGQDTSDENLFHIFQRFVGKAGFEAHSASDHHSARDLGAFASDPVRCFYNEARRAPVLRKPKFGKVKSIKPDSRGLNLMLKCVSCEAVEEGTTQAWRAVLGDDTGVVTFSLRDAAHAAACTAGSSLRVQNARVVMVKGHINVVVDKFAVLKTADEPVEGEVDSAKDVSATEYEMVRE